MPVRQPLTRLDQRGLLRAAWLLLWAVATLVALGEPGYAEPADPLTRPEHPQAREHLARGNKLYAVREFARAIEEYKAGALLEDATVFQYNLAQSYRLLGNHEEALWHYERFLKRAQPQEPLRSAVLQFIEQQKAASEKATAHASAPSAQANEPGSEQRVRHGSAAPPRRRPWTHDRLGWSLVGSGIALGAASGVLFVLARSLDRDGNAEPLESRREDLRDRAQNRRIAAYLTGGLGVFALGAGGVRLWLHDDGRDVVGATVSGRF